MTLGKVIFSVFMFLVFIAMCYGLYLELGYLRNFTENFSPAKFLLATFLWSIEFLTIGYLIGQLRYNAKTADNTICVLCDKEDKKLWYIKIEDRYKPFCDNCFVQIQEEKIIQEISKNMRSSLII